MQFHMDNKEKNTKNFEAGQDDLRIKNKQVLNRIRKSNFWRGEGSEKVNQWEAK